ncbi:short-chain dehydrogenase [Ectothiorhodospira haloalkaliphila]|uniref:Short-chain dehydrogenase n=1 Tax=Ectothiorhodospira haloalkaliphila TaxID=421628 RepID=W8KML6_9GAMM|nr:MULTISPECIES: SDR family NAD(P)-dependent oxidoreductase [Ectothiorhodospira]AHK80418.1 short-chain dehydrogenase [Ectothiorhodospira haloalkaliphila]MCG5494929.1 SDR family oxidoreductase [Ectothiorhodospira variabilis]MCG5497664.1 SDR family oxidoreductase [Ectothiorhodospira variabilis]MCG5504442.1 SDR family oxidoreductase [Ectothiorhodospira variabilis]MCG5507597.1 SDR family oxidoreductase [Ectothiorhodospira variabilis]
MKQPVVVITGGTRGIGYGLVRAFLQRQCRVMTCGRDAEQLAQGLWRLRDATAADEARLQGQTCDVADPSALQRLWDAAVEHFGGVDIWINNAAVNSHEVDFWEHDPATIEQLIRINLLGTLHGCHIAARGMLAQGHGRIYTLEGWGSSNERRRGSTLYGTSKAALRYFTRSLADELQGTPVRLGSINPGVVPTDLLALSIHDGKARQIRRFINIFGDTVDTVAPGLAERVLNDRRHGSRIRWLTPGRAIGRLLLAPFRQRTIIAPDSGTGPGDTVKEDREDPGR